MSTAVVVHEGSAELAQAFMPVMQMQQAVQRYNAVLAFTQDIMKPGKDYGTVPGVDKPSLLKPGAEKLCSFFGLTPKFVVVKETEAWDGDEPFFYYWYKCQLWRGSVLIAEGDGSCNSRESKYRYRWVNEDQIPAHLNRKQLTSRGGRISEFEFAIEKAETTGKYGKPAEYWQKFKDAIANHTATLIQKPIRTGGTKPAWEIDSTVWRVPNPDVSDQVNTIQKMAQKRALIAATLIACNASEYYTQDIEDMDSINVPFTATSTPATAPVQKAEPKPEGTKPSTLDEVLATFKNPATAAEAYRQLKAHFVKALDESVWNQILDEHKVDHTLNTFGTLGTAKKCFTALWKTLENELEMSGLGQEGN